MKYLWLKNTKDIAAGSQSVIFRKMRVMGIKSKVGISTVIIVVISGFLLPEKLVIPVLGASEKDWNHDTFWYEPWGASGVHKGIDIFSSNGTPVVSSSYGIVLYKGALSRGGNVVVVLGPKWRIHYYAHLKDISIGFGALVNTSGVLGSVGTTGNAKGKSAHLHYSILTLVHTYGE